MATFKLRSPVKHYPRSIFPLSKTEEAGPVVNLVRKETSTLFIVKTPDLSEPFTVLASEVEEINPA